MIYNYNVFLYIAARVHFYRFLYVWRLFVATVTKGTIIMGEGVHFWVALNAYDNYHIILIIIFIFHLYYDWGAAGGQGMMEKQDTTYLQLSAFLLSSWLRN